MNPVELTVQTIPLKGVAISTADIFRPTPGMEFLIRPECQVPGREDIGYTVVVTDCSETQITGYLHDGREGYDRELQLSFYLKRDECLHFSFGGSHEGKRPGAIGYGATDGYLHLCGPGGVELFVWVMRFLPAWAERCRNNLRDEANGIVFNVNT